MAEFLQDTYHIQLNVGMLAPKSASAWIVRLFIREADSCTL